MKVAVLGAGTMGHGIAQVSAMAGHQVTMHDIEEAHLQRGIDAIASNLDGGVDRGKVEPDDAASTQERIGTTTDLEVAVADADLVVEGVPEDLALKKEVFESVDASAADDAILATNTSSFPVTEIVSVLGEPGRAIGLHFFNPAHIMSLVEIVVPEQATAETVSFAEEFVTGIDREPIIVRDSAGFATSRAGVALGLEAVRMVESGVASVEDVDSAMELGYNHPIGPLELTDVVGLDVRLNVAEHLRKELGERFRPPQFLRQKVRAGNLGKKTGEGFYVWEDGEAVAPSEGGFGG